MAVRGIALGSSVETSAHALPWIRMEMFPWLPEQIDIFAMSAISIEWSDV